jgi:hypothetical protein
MNCLANRSLNEASPPRSGCAGPMMMTFFEGNENLVFAKILDKGESLLCRDS